MRNDCGLRIADCGFRRDAMHRWSRPSIRSRLLSIRNPKSEIRNGISLIEILISMFVLLFGLMGVASIFPVGSHYMTEGEKFDFGSALTQNAFEEMEIRGMLRPELWLYGTNFVVMNSNEEFDIPYPPNSTDRRGPGHAFVIDPMGAAAHGFAADGDIFPYWDLSLNEPGPNVAMPDVWLNPLQNAGARFPVRRLTLPQALGAPLAETIFRLRDDLSVELPEKSDQPGVQLWTVDSGGQLLTRQYNGRYSWLATVVPTSGLALEGLQPVQGATSYSYDVSVVIFHRRVPTPSIDTERLIEAELLVGGELVLFDRNGDPAVVDAAVEDIRPGNWICLMGVNQSTGGFLMKWYRLLSLDDETDTSGSFSAERHAMLIGPNWPNPSDNSVINLRAAILPGAVSVVTRTMQLENN